MPFIPPILIPPLNPSLIPGARQLAATIVKVPALQRNNNALFQVWARAMNMKEAGATPPPDVETAIHLLGKSIERLQQMDSEVVAHLKAGFEEAQRRGFVKASDRPEGLSGFVLVLLLPIALGIAAAFIITAARGGFDVPLIVESLWPREHAAANGYAVAVTAWEKNLKPGEPIPPLPGMPGVPGSLGGSVSSLAMIGVVGFGLWLLLGRKR